ncbi:MAG TPA: hypothetical protein VFT37_00805 [Telluria sp.]|nr:hypothetical protein [Telluria sp.]
MKSSFVRVAIAGALALTLAACGGKEQFTVQGKLIDVKNAGMTLKTNGQTISPAAGATTFAFPQAIEYGEVYNVEIATDPRHQNCSFLTKPNGTAGQTAVIDVWIRCFQDTYTIGGTVTGLTADGLVLANGTSGGTVAIPKTATGYVFPNEVEDGTTYGVTVLTQPTGQVCSVANATGTMGEAKVENVHVSCTTPLGN